MHDYGWNPVTQVFDVKSVPKEIKNILQKAAFKKKHLKEKETALAIYEFLMKNIDPSACISSDADTSFLNRINRGT